MHDKIQYGDKCSLPTSIGRLIFEKRYDVPWIFEIKPVKDNKVNSITDESSKIQSDKIVRKLEKSYISPLDFRSPENYVFLPKWLMDDLNLQSNDLVDVSLVRIKLAELVVFQPLSIEWVIQIAKHDELYIAYRLCFKRYIVDYHTIVL